MSEQIFFLDAAKTTLTPLAPTNFQTLTMKEADIEALLAKHNGVLFGMDLLWVGRQTWASDNQRSDLIGIDAYGALVVAELKRGEASADSLTQALGYAAQFSNLALEDLARIWTETGTKASGLVSVSPASVKDAVEQLRKRAESGSELNSEQIIVIAAESFDARLLAACDYLSEALESSKLSVECWEYRAHVLPANAGLVVTFRQVVPSRTVRDEIAARQELREEKGWKRTVHFKNALQKYLTDKLSGAGWQFDRENKWYSLTVRNSGWSSSDVGSIEFRDGPEPVIYLPPGRTIANLKNGVTRLADWTDHGIVWQRYKLPVTSGAPFTSELGDLAAEALQAVGAAAPPALPMPAPTAVASAGAAPAAPLAPGAPVTTE